ncbi:MAG: sulfurtransferase FdhD [Robiginitomaculum sp.]|nr:MAG: sulfurtransferase FdhD [Robiginitomaculum sp.]
MTIPSKGCRDMSGHLIGEQGVKQLSWVLPEECPIAICLNGESYAVMLATPLDLEDFAIGFCLSEGLVTARDKILSIQQKVRKDGIEVHITLSDEALERVQLMDRRRRLAGGSGCGICGLSSLSHVGEMPVPLVSDLKIPLASILKVRAAFENHTPLHQRCYSVHGAVFADVDGNVLVAREDVGRHNALDKLIGSLSVQGLDVGQGFVMITSRFAYELVQKCARLKVPVAVSISAPTTMAIEMARAANMTLGAFSGKDELMVFSAENRLV